MMCLSLKRPALCFFVMLTTGALAKTAAAQSSIKETGLNRRTPKVTFALSDLYETLDYKSAYWAAHDVYEKSVPATAYRPVEFDPHNPEVWLTATQRSLKSYANQIGLLEKQLDRLENDLDPKTDGAKVAQKRQLEDNLTKRSFYVLTGLIVDMPLDSLFKENNMPAEASLWTYRPIRFDRNEEKLSMIHTLSEQIAADLDATTSKIQIRDVSLYAKINGNWALRDSTGRDVKRERISSVWYDGPRDKTGKYIIDAKGNRPKGSREILDAAMIKLFFLLGQANAAIATEHLFSGPKGDLGQAASTAPSKGAGNTSTSILNVK